MTSAGKLSPPPWRKLLLSSITWLRQGKLSPLQEEPLLSSALYKYYTHTPKESIIILLLIESFWGSEKPKSLDDNKKIFSHQKTFIFYQSGNFLWSSTLECGKI